MRTKEEIVEKFSGFYKNSNYVVVIDYKGMNSEDVSLFRRDLRLKCDSKFFVVKNTLNKISASGSDYDFDLGLKGQCGVIFCNDLVNVSKVVNDFCFKNQKAKLVGCFNKTEKLDDNYIKKLSSLPSIDVLRAKIVWTLQYANSRIYEIFNEYIKKTNGESGGSQE